MLLNPDKPPSAAQKSRHSPSRLGKNDFTPKNAMTNAANREKETNLLILTSFERHMHSQVQDRTETTNAGISVSIHQAISRQRASSSEKVDRKQCFMCIKGVMAPEAMISTSGESEEIPNVAMCACVYVFAFANVLQEF